MRKVTRYETSDGVLHATVNAAQKHADKRYGNELGRLARLLCATDGKYLPMAQALHDNLDACVALMALRGDLVLVNEAEDDED